MSVDGAPGMYLMNALQPNAFTEAAMRWDGAEADYEKYLTTLVSLLFYEFLRLATS